ncbi:hypothetical protein [Zestomonas carbonaria]|uniref:Tat (Twin-arginine translocation) pathway signal sequence n=1 Tax=Zestomonas carbonaria TaxID=2762745 RepID=A0A7U7I9M8_9GAMM|nr:hypothetical protein [Pseudomonas carbonaria]CAD5108579.1 hypothetical protein PSEWESI4_02867 [Pseudomonas carbonaria]
MNVERRSLLKGLALGGLAGAALGGSGLAVANAVVGGPSLPEQPILALVNGETAESAFLLGIGASPVARQVEVLRADAGLDFLLGLEKRLRGGRPQRLIGLLDDASAALVLDLARSAGARVQWLGQHGVGATASRHRLLGAESANGCAPHLGRHLNACGAGFDLSAQRFHGGQAPLRLAAPARSTAASGQWAATLGFTLATLGRIDTARAPLASDQRAPLTGHFVSFSIEA